MCVATTNDPIAPSHDENLADAFLISTPSNLGMVTEGEAPNHTIAFLGTIFYDGNGPKTLHLITPYSSTYFIED